MTAIAIRPPAPKANAMFEVTVQLNSWGLGDALIVMTMPVDGELSSLLDASYSVEVVPVSEAG